MFTKIVSSMIVLLLLAVCGCTTDGRRPSTGMGVPATQERLADSTPARPESPGQLGADLGEQTEALSLRHAAALALLNNPELGAFSWQVRATQARQLQAGLAPNPELEVEVEEMGGTGERRGFNSAETAIQLGLPIELAGKRAKRKRVASLETDLAHLDYESKRLDVLAQVTRAFVDVLAAQERLALAEELVHISKEAQSAVVQKVTAGRDSPIEQTKATMVVSKARIGLERARQALTSARYALAATWSGRTAAFEKVTGDFYEISAAPDLDDLRGLISDNPDVVRWAVERDKRRAALQLERAKATSDVTIKGGYQYLEEGDDSAFIVGVSIPVPLFDRNQGGIQEAGHLVAKAEDDRRAAETSVLAALSAAVERLSGACVEANVLREEILPAAQSAFDAASEGYREGKFDYLNVLDAQRTLFEAKGQYVESLAGYHKATADVERLIGQSMDDLSFHLPERPK